MKYIHELEDIFRQRTLTMPPSLTDVMHKLNYRPVLLYGAGAFGKENLSLFRQYGVQPIAFLDRNAKPDEEKEGIPVYNPDSKELAMQLREECQVFISITLPKRKIKEIQQRLWTYGYRFVSAVQSITARQIKFEGALEENPNIKYFMDNYGKIQRAFQLLADEESRKTYISCIRGHMFRQYDDCVETDFPLQYFDAGVPLKKGVSCFVDCGAYNGDSLKTALDVFGKIKEYIAFEPVWDNFSHLSGAVEQYEKKIGRAFLYPCGLSDRTGAANFTLADSASSIREDGEGDILPIVKLDDVLKNVQVSFLKMDIEGAEPSALRGARCLIKQQSPDLAISVYHAANHFWDIPCLIESINPCYKFYLRTHTPATLESVLYCTK